MSPLLSRVNHLCYLNISRDCMADIESVSALAAEASDRHRGNLQRADLSTPFSFIQVIYGDCNASSVEMLRVLSRDLMIPMISRASNEQAWPDVLSRRVSENMHKFAANGTPISLSMFSTLSTDLSVSTVRHINSILTLLCNLQTL